MTRGFLYLCERCDDLTENKPDHRGRVRCRACGGPPPASFTVSYLGESGMRSITVDEELGEASLRDLISHIGADSTIYAISTPATIAEDVAGITRPDPYEFERAWLRRINAEHMLPSGWGEAA